MNSTNKDSVNVADVTAAEDHCFNHYNRPKGQRVVKDGISVPMYHFISGIKHGRSTPSAEMLERFAHEYADWRNNPNHPLNFRQFIQAFKQKEASGK